MKYFYRLILKDPYIMSHKNEFFSPLWYQLLKLILKHNSQSNAFNSIFNRFSTIFYPLP